MTMPSMRQLIQWCVLSLLLLTPGLALAQQHVLVADEGASAVGYRSQVGRVLTFICPSKLNTSREIWGTDNYMYESPICTAAVHAGGSHRACPARSRLSWGLVPSRLKGWTATA